MTVSSRLLEGFLSEAEGYTQTLRQLLRDSGPVKEIQTQLDVLGGAAEMLGLDDLADLALPAADDLGELLAAGQGFDEALHARLTTLLDSIEAALEAATPADEPAPEPEQPPAFIPDLPPDLLEIFTVEANDHIQTLYGGLEADERDLKELRRAAHTLKGSSASVGFEQMAHIAHRMEDLLDAAIEGTPLTQATVALLSDAVFALENLLRPDPTVDMDGLLASLTERFGQIPESDQTTFQVKTGTPNGSGALTDHIPPDDTPTNPEPILRMHLSRVDQLVNQVGELVLNHGVLGEHLKHFRGLVAELSRTSRRLHRIARDIDARIETTTVSRTGTGDPLFDAIELERYTALHQLNLGLEEVVTDTSTINNRLTLLVEDIDAALLRERRLTSDLQEKLVATRLMAFTEIETRLHRTVQRTARELGKPIELVIEGFDTRVDKTILDALLDPLVHLLRNAVDHGIETLEQREQAGKPPTGTITLSVRRDRGRVQLTMVDDGGGVNLSKVRRKAEEAGVIAKNAILSEDELLNLIFEDGLSAADQITETSGRGVGLNIVYRTVRKLQGAIRVESQPGKGTRFTLSVPVALAINRALFVHSSGQTFAVPIEQVERVLRLTPEALGRITTDRILYEDGQRLTVFDLTLYIEGQQPADDIHRYGLVIKADDNDVAVLVDRLAGIHEIVVKPLGNHLRRVRGVTGGTISGSGEVLLILDLFELINTGTETSTDVTMPERPQRRRASDGLNVLVVDDSPSVRRVVANFLEAQGWQTSTARDGIEALEILAETTPDVALVDIEMPRMNGYELLSHIKSNPELQHLPVVFLTSRSASKHRNRAEQLGVDGYLVKPYREVELITELKRVTEHAR